MAAISENLSSTARRLKGLLSDFPSTHNIESTYHVKPTFDDILASEEFQKVRGNLKAEDDVIRRSLILSNGYENGTQTIVDFRNAENVTFEKYNEKAKRVLQKVRERAERRRKKDIKPLIEAENKGQLIFKYPH